MDELNRVDLAILHAMRREHITAAAKEAQNARLLGVQGPRHNETGRRLRLLILAMLFASLPVAVLILWVSSS
jgi:hypothetical protein